MANIHPTAVVEPGARVADAATIGPFCFVSSKAVIGAGTRLVSHVSILGATELGEGNTVWPQAVLGADPQDLKFQGENVRLQIGGHNEIREMVTMHPGTANGGGLTRVGDSNLIMIGTHVAHDCVVGSHNVMANYVGLAGHVHIEDHVNIAGFVGVHHFVTFGQYSFVGGMSRIVHDVPPFMIVEGNPSSVRGPNIIGMTRHRFDAQYVEHMKEAFRRLYRRTIVRDGGETVGDPMLGKSLLERLDTLEHEFPDDECIHILARFVRNTALGMHGRYQESLRHDRRMTNPVR